MTKLVAGSCFAYGCVASAGALVWYLAALAGNAELPKSVWVAEGFLVVHVIVMIITFPRGPRRRPWEPVLQMTNERIRAAKVALGIVTVNFVFCVAVVAWENRGASERALLMVLTSFALLNMVYIAIHWAFRPENLFPDQFLAFISHPMVYLFFRPRRPRQLPRSERDGH